MQQNVVNDPGLKEFIAANGVASECRLMLPHFTGTAIMAEGNMPDALVYRGFTFAERDSRAAFYVHSLIGPIFAPEKLAIQSAVPGQPVPNIAFLFGSRSNPVTQEILKNSGQGLFEFEFGPAWKIRCSGAEFSVPDPSRLMDPLQYQNSTDYAVVARIHDGEGRVFFVIAGLGGRATEGAARFFVNNWRSLASSFGQDDFAAVLEFAAPFDMNRCQVVATAQRPSPDYKYA